MKRRPLKFKVRVTPTGDRASAEDAASIIVAARQLLRDARDNGAGDPRASFFANGKLVRGNVKRSEV